VTVPESPPGVDLARLAEYLAAKAPDLLDGEPTATLVAGGRSNLTYVLNDEFVLRRPPLGHVLATAHDMTREYRVISALVQTPVPVPEPMLLCEDDSVLGAPFYIMRRVPGVVYRNRTQTDPLGEDGRRRLAFEMVDTLRTLHAVDPASVGLAGFGHPEGFLERQVRRWAAQLDRSRSRELPGADELHDRLAASVPQTKRAGIVHGDFRLDNLMVDPDSLTVAAVLDWEMATLGDPLCDLGLLVTYWDIRGGDLTGPIADGVGVAAGFPSGTELLERYGADEDLSWYIGLGCYKLAVILEGIHYRFTQGKTVGGGFDQIGTLVTPLLDHGLAAISREQ
jgi:aminoglycoside phosphotransferase (APT) family kinase protein